MTNAAPSTPSNTDRAMTVLAFQIAVMAISLATGIITARLLGAYGRGVYAVAFIPPQILASLIGGGMSDATIYLVSGGHETRPRILRVLGLLTVAGSFGLCALLAAMWLPLQHNVLKGVTASVFVAASASTPFALWSALSQAYLFGSGRTALSQGPLVAERVATLTGLVVAAVLGAGLLTIVTVSTAGVALGALFGLVAIGRHDVAAALHAGRSRGTTRQLIGYGGTLLAANLAQKLTYRLDQLLVNLFAGPAAVGVYALAARLADVPLLAPRALRNSWVASRARDGDITGNVNGTIQGARKLIALMTLLLPLYALVVAPLVPVVYGEDFAPAVGPFLILLVATFALSTSFAFSSGLTGGGRPRQLVIATWCGLATTVALDAALVPPLGATGAALASFGAYAIFAFVVFRLWHRQAGAAVGAGALVPRGADWRALATLPWRSWMIVRTERPVRADS